MSRVYFATRGGHAAELLGAERAWLGYLARSQAHVAWDLEFPSSHERVEQLLGWVVPTRRNYVHELLRGWRAAEASDAPGAGRVASERWCDLLAGLRVFLQVDGYELEVAGHRLHTHDVGFNAALVAGSRPVQLAAKLHGYCEVHTFVEGPHRAWLADVIVEGLRTGLYRRTLGQLDGEAEVELDLGWREVVALLREADDEPVVTSYSVTDDFPNPTVADWDPPSLDPDWRPDWARDHDGVEEWADLSGDDRAAHRRDHEREAWYDLPVDERWDRALTGLRRRPWLELTPASLGGSFFGPAVTPYDLWAPDVDDRVRRACATGYVRLTDVTVAALGDDEDEVTT